MFAIQAQAQRLRHSNAVLQCALLDGRGLQLHAPASGAVRLGQHQGNLVARLQQLRQCHAGEFRRAGEDQPHARVASRCCLSILVLMRLRLSGER